MKTKFVFVLGGLALFAAIIGAGLIFVGGLFLKNFLSGTQRVAQYRAHDRVELSRISEAERDLKNGKGREALVALAPVEVLDSNRGCMITLIQAAALCMTDGSCDRVRRELKSGVFSALIFNCDELYQKLLQYSAYTARHASPRAAGELIDTAMYLDPWISPRSDLTLIQAEYYLQGGDRQRAANLCQRLWDDGEENLWNWSYVENDAAFKRKLSALKEQAGSSDERWLTAKELQAFPVSYVIYLQPLGRTNPQLLEAVRANVEMFFGATTKILPALPLTHRERSFIPQENKYDAEHLLPDTVKKLHIPSDAFSVVLITGEKIGTPEFAWIYSRSDQSRHLVSYNILSDWELHWQIVTLSHVVVANISLFLGQRGHFPCITSGIGDREGARRVKFAYSPEIQECYRTADLAAVHAGSINDYKAWGATIETP